MTILPWKILSSQYALKDKWITVRVDRCETPTGLIVDSYYVVETDDWGHIVAFDSEYRILITRQYRHGIKAISVEIPCGVIEPGEDPEVGMRRELREETGATAAVFEALPPVSPNPVRYANTIYSFIALDTKIESAQSLDPTEEIQFEFVAVDKVLAMIENGEVRHPLHIASIYHALRKLGMLQFVSPKKASE